MDEKPIRRNAGGPMLVEPLAVARMYEIQWRKKTLDLAELAKLRWVEMWSIGRIAEALDRSPNTIDWALQALKKGGLQKLSFDNETRLRIESNRKKCFHGK